MFATIWLTMPGSNSGVSVPGIFGPPGTIPTHRIAPAIRPRNHDSDSEESDTAGASGFGGPNSTRWIRTATAIAVRARPAATANAPTGSVLNAPKKVISFAVTV